MNKAVLVTRTGAQPELALAPDSPRPAPHELRLSMQAAALNHADLLMIQGRYQDTPAAPYIAGMEGVGIVVEAGAQSGFAVGQRVGVVAQGTLAEHMTVPAAQCFAVPERMKNTEAAGFAIAYGSSHLALTRLAGVGQGDLVIVTGAGSGVGLTAVEVAHALGARVIAVLRGEEKARVAREAGAAEAVDTEGLDDAALRKTLRGFGKARVVYDAVGAEIGRAAFDALGAGGHFLVIGFAGGGVPELPLNHALVKNISIHGFYWGGLRQIAPEAVSESLDALMSLYEQGRIRPHIGVCLPFSEALQGFELMRARAVTGKLVIEIAPPAPA